VAPVGPPDCLDEKPLLPDSLALSSREEEQVEQEQVEQEGEAEEECL
jgi:hypothetical protein